jgi:aminopeptidase N
MSKSVPRLYETFQPEAYDLTIDLDEQNLRFSGTVTIRGKKVGRPSKRLTFHANGLKVTEAHIKHTDKKGERDIPVARLNLQKSAQEVRLHTESSLYAGDYEVTLSFNADITTGMTGLYPCPYQHEGKEKVLFATQFESHHAREVFPCVDEPEAKAVFNLTLVTDKDQTTLANTPVKSQSDKDGRAVTVFEPSPRMSSYLLAWAVGELQSKSSKTQSGVSVSIYSTKAQPIDSLDFALDTAVRSIEFFEDYFGVPYPLAKSDHIALPDFSSAAMENWGLITYRERVLLAYPGESSQSVRELIAMVIAHETSHQWFGNLVTMRWWNDLWLNESFANMMEYRALDAMFPEWQCWDSFIAGEGLSSLRRDATPGVQPVKVEVHHPDEINTLFDPSIVYAKGGRLLYMLMNYIGEDAFRTGLSNYFKKFAYKNTEGKDLWDELSKASNIDVGAFMDPWLERPGFPVISINQDGVDLTISQQHFSDNPEKADPGRLWPVPLFSTSHSVPVEFHTQEIKTQHVGIHTVRINEGARGHYIVSYASDDQRKALASLAKDGTLSNAERLMLLNDTSMLARAGYQPYVNVLDLLDAYENESNESVWDIISLISGETRRFIDLDESLEEKVKSFVRSLIAKQHARLGWDEKDGEPSTDQKLRGIIIGLGAYADDPAVIDEAYKRFEAYKKDPTSLSPEIRAIVFGIPVKQGKKEVADYLLKLHDETTNSDLKSDISAALTITRDPAYAKKLLARLKDPKLIKPQDADRWLVYLLRNRFVRETAWDWMVSEWAWIEETYGHDKSYDYMPRYAATVCNTEEWQKKYHVFFEPKLNQLVLKRNIQIGFEEIEVRVKWLKRDLQSVRTFLAEA